VSQTVDGLTTNYVYDRNRLQTATAVGGATSKYNYDPLGRLDTVTSGGQIVEKLVYDGFDRTVEQRTGAGAHPAMGGCPRGGHRSVGPPGVGPALGGDGPAELAAARRPRRRTAAGPARG